MKGVYPKDDIIRMVHNADYRELPEEFTKRLNALEQSFSGEIDPGRISTEIDRAYLEHCLNNAVLQEPGGFYQHTDDASPARYGRGGG